jgi:hypothetical protein
LLPLIKDLSAEELVYRLIRGFAFKTAFQLFSLGEELANARVLIDREGLLLRKLLGPVYGLSVKRSVTKGRRLLQKLNYTEKPIRKLLTCNLLIA